MSRLPPGGALRAGAHRTQQIESLLSDLGSQICRASGLQQRGDGLQEHTAQLPVGRPEIDRLLGGGFPLGALSEVSGASSSGRTSLALALLATTTARGALAGWVDGVDAFDPLSAERLGVDLDRVLWVRTSSWREALGATERLIQTEGFPLVLLDWTAQPTGLSTSAWLRLTRLAASSRTTLLLLSSERLAGAHAAISIEMQPARAHFTGTPALLEELETRMVLVRNRSAPIDPNTSHRIPTPSRMTPPRESAA